MTQESILRKRIENSQYFKDGKLSIDGDNLYLLPIMELTLEDYGPDERRNWVSDKIKDIVRNKQLDPQRDKIIALVHSRDVSLSTNVRWVIEDFPDIIIKIYKRDATEAYLHLMGKAITPSYLKDLENKLQQ